MTFYSLEKTARLSSVTQLFSVIKDKIINMYGLNAWGYPLMLQEI
jgi:hypothetical protein